MKYCSNCGATVAFRIPPGDSLPRHVCEQCGTIHYQNPKLVVGALAEWGFSPATIDALKAAGAI